MKIIDELILESSRLSRREIIFYIKLIQKTYDSWKFSKKRRKNAVDLSTSTCNKIAKIPDTVVSTLPPVSKRKLAILCMRVLDCTPWTDIGRKAKPYKKIQHLLNPLMDEIVNTQMGSNLLEVVCTRLSVSISGNSDDLHFVHYEPKMTRAYATHIFSNSHFPQKIYKAKTPERFPVEFEELVDEIKSRHEKAKSCLSRESS